MPTFLDQGSYPNLDTDAWDARPDVDDGLGPHIHALL
jgi:hypothetical protein